MFLSPSQVQVIEKTAFESGVQAEALMETAGKGIAQIVRQFHPLPGHVVAWCGKGNNAGDVLVAARILVQWGWSAKFCCAFPEAALGKLAAQKLTEFRNVYQSLHSSASSGPLVILDGLLGTGAHGSPCPEICRAIDAIYQLRRANGAWVLAADIPTGLDGESGEASSCCVQADLTATIGFVKNGLVADAATPHVGRLAFIPLKELDAKEGDPAELITPHILRPWFPPRSFDSYKGMYGRVGILAGSQTFPGAARLCAQAALRAGAGYVILFVTEDIYPLIVSSVPPEIIVHPIRSFQKILEQPLDALCIGPGLGQKNHADILDIVQNAAMPCVVDADALNAIATSPQILHDCHGLRLLTPHSGEFARIAPHLAKLPRREAAETFVADKQITLLLKGARTIIAEKGIPSLFNSTGNPGMASGGMGDTLTGVCGALLAQGLSPHQAASAGAWLCGRAAEIAIFLRGQSPESLLASDISDNLGQAFRAVSAADLSF